MRTQISDLNQPSMIQRLQSVFLFLAILVMGAYLLLPAIETTGVEFSQISKGFEVKTRQITPFGVYFFYCNAILLGTAMGLSLINIFLFKWRKVQSVVVWLTIPFIIAALTFTIYKWQTIQSLYVNQRLIVLDVYFTPWNFLLLLAVILQALAFMYIRKDEALIKSLDRLR